MEKITKADLKQPDLFVESASTFWVFVEENFKVIMGAFLVLVLASVIYIGKNFFNDRTEKHAINDLYPVESEVLKIKDGFEKAKRGAGADQAEDGAPPTKKVDSKPATGDLQADYGASLGRLEAFASSHQENVAGAEAGLIAAGIYSDYQKPDKAVEILTPLAQKFQNQGSVLVSALLQMALGTAQATKGDCKSAVSSWQKVIDNDKLKFLAGDAHLKTGVCFETLGDMNQARDHYEKASAAEGNVSKNAKTLLRALEVKKSQAG